MKKISCSVVVPVFNPDLKVFEVMLGSLVKQTYQSFEVILVDDSDKIDVTKIVEKFPNLSIKHIKNSQKLGLTKSLNYGISLSRQEFIARADCDDFYEEDRLEKQISFLKKIQCMICVALHVLQSTFKEITHINELLKFQY